MTAFVKADKNHKCNLKLGIFLSIFLGIYMYSIIFPALSVSAMNST